MPPRVHYLVPDYAPPSWGQGMLYEHVRLLVAAGVDAAVLHHERPFRLPWLDLEVPTAWLSDGVAPQPQDVVVVPEVQASTPLPWPCRPVVFAQASFLLLGGRDEAFRYPDLGFELALAVLPHVARAVERHFGIAARLVPPFVAPYFLRSPAEVAERRRERVVLLMAKPEYRRAGFPDYDIVRCLVRRAFAERGDGWALEELSGLTHRQVAERMASAAFLVNLNSHEAFNSTVPEAMASGCLPVCYEAVGGRDVLTDGVDSFVFPNHHAYDLVERLLGLVDVATTAPATLVPMRLAARAAAAAWSPERTQRALLAALGELLPAAPG